MSPANHATRRMRWTRPRAVATPPSRSAGSHSSPMSRAQGRNEAHHRLWFGITATVLFHRVASGCIYQGCLGLVGNVQVF